MERIRRLLTIVLALTIILSLFAGCGSSSDDEEEDASEVETETVEESAANDSEDAEEEEKTDESESDEAGGSITYPITDEILTLTLWATINPSALELVDSYSENTIIQKGTELTGIELECTSIAGNLASDQFPIMISTGDYTDFIGSVSTLYSDGIEAAIDNEIIIDLSPYLEEYAPDYYALLSSDEEYLRAFTTDSGRSGVFAMLGEGTTMDSGYMTRKDWLDELGLDVPVTYDDWYECLTAMYTEYGATLYINPIGAGSRNTLTDGYGTTFYTDSMEGYLPFYVVDGVVKCGYVEDATRDYLEMMAQWYSEGLVWKDFASGGTVVSAKDSTAYDSILNGDISFFLLEMGDLTSTPEDSDDPDMELIAVANPVLEEGDTTHIALTGLTYTAKWSISTECEYIEEAVMYVNYWFTEEGAELGNYGIEGEAFEWVDGERQWTELMLNNPDNIDIKILACVYLLDDHPFYLDVHRMDNLYSDEELECSDIWLSNREGDWTYPSFAELSEDELEVYSLAMSDITTYAEETIPKFITGDLDIEAEWDNFVQQCYDIGLEDCINARQSAYDRYMSR